MVGQTGLSIFGLIYSLENWGGVQRHIVVTAGMKVIKRVVLSLTRTANVSITPPKKRATPPRDALTARYISIFY
jgi:hypothetical protein